MTSGSTADDAVCKSLPLLTGSGIKWSQSTQLASPSPSSDVSTLSPQLNVGAFIRLGPFRFYVPLELSNVQLKVWNCACSCITHPWTCSLVDQHALTLGLGHLPPSNPCSLIPSPSSPRRMPSCPCTPPPGRRPDHPQAPTRRHPLLRGHHRVAAQSAPRRPEAGAHAGRRSDGPARHQGHGPPGTQGVGVWVEEGVSVIGPPVRQEVLLCCPP